MDSMSDKIKGLLDDEESMQQLRELADMLNAGIADSVSEQSAESIDPPPKSGAGGMPDISQLMGMIGGNTGNSPDMELIMQLIGILRTSSENDDSRALLMALRPLLSADKQERIDKAVKLLRIYTVYKELQSRGMLTRLGDMI
ncbi:MAG: hypothetical protein II664_01950 [Oscillospiraceae bacterium]|nr:hypothetical protein [Oscillospiraceae bacterium]